MNPPRLVIDYSLDPPRPGYTFRTGTDGLDEGSLRKIWQHAMPRGQGWASGYIGASSLKAFPLGDGRMALSGTLVTDLADELGRKGIRRAEISVFTPAEYPQIIDSLLASFPTTIRQQAYRRLSTAWWQRFWDRLIPHLSSHRQLVLAHPYTTPDAWQIIEALVLFIVVSPHMRALNGWGPQVSFTTLALDYREESRIVALPTRKALELSNIPLVHV